jgi:hypothetical protein
MEDLSCAIISEGNVMAPAVLVSLFECDTQMLTSPQSLTERELLALHAEVKALQQQQGLSYKDAAHRLYHSEVQKLKVEDVTRKVFLALDREIKTTVKDHIWLKIKNIDDAVEAKAEAEDKD